MDAVERVHAVPERCGERHVAQDVDHPRDASRRLMDSGQGGSIENVPIRPRHRQPVTDVARRFGPRLRRQVDVIADQLRDCGVPRLLQPCTELRLADERAKLQCETKQYEVLMCRAVFPRSVAQSNSKCDLAFEWSDRTQISGVFRIGAAAGRFSRVRSCPLDDAFRPAGARIEETPRRSCPPRVAAHAPRHRGVVSDGFVEPFRCARTVEWPARTQVGLSCPPRAPSDPTRP
jgi:hypothetical protein